MMDAISVMEKATLTVEGETLVLIPPSGYTERFSNGSARMWAAESLDTAAEHLRFANAYREAGEVEAAAGSEQCARDELAIFAALMEYAQSIGQ